MDMAEKAEMTTTSGNQETGNGARRLNSLGTWLRGKKRPAEVPPDELKTSSELAEVLMAVNT